GAKAHVGVREPLALRIVERDRKDGLPARQEAAIEIEVVELLGARAHVAVELELELLGLREIEPDVGEPGRPRDVRRSERAEDQRETERELHGPSRSMPPPLVVVVFCCGATTGCCGCVCFNSGSRKVARSAVD